MLQCELHIPGSASLKDKRRVVKSLKDRLHRHHMVSVAEIEALDHHRIAVLGMTMASNAVAPVVRTFDRITEKLRSLPDVRLEHVQRDILDADQLPVNNPETLWTEDDRREGDAS